MDYMSLPSNSLDTCVRYCSSNSLCNSISYCMNPEFVDTWNCHLKDRELFGNEPTKTLKGCTSYHKIATCNGMSYVNICK